jgi:hypothetical protein
MTTINDDDFIEVYVKVVYTSITGKYKINKNSNIDKFIKSIQKEIYLQHGLDTSMYELILHSVESQPGIKDEEKNAFHPEHPDYLVNYYFNDTKFVAFYLRYLNDDDTTQIQLQGVGGAISGRRRISETPVVGGGGIVTTRTINDDDAQDECIVCFDTEPALLTSYGCRHLICRGCFRECLRNNICNCPVCRRALRSS